MALQYLPPVTLVTFRALGPVRLLSFGRRAVLGGSGVAIEFGEPPKIQRAAGRLSQRPEKEQRFANWEGSRIWIFKKIFLVFGWG